MRIHLYPIAVPLMLTLTACVTDYTKSEAPNNLRVDGAQTRVDVSFIPGSARLARSDAVQQLVRAGRIRPADRVTIAASGSPGLAEQRVMEISREPLAYGIVAETVPHETAPANQAIVGIDRYTVTLPPCPNWSSPPTAEYTNAHWSNWGCAEAANLGLMVASPADLVSGRNLGPADGTTAAAAVRRYHDDKVKPLLSGQAAPFAATPGGGGDSGGAPGAGAGTQ